MIITVLREDKGKQRANPDANKGVDTYPGRNEDKETRRANNAPVANPYRTDVTLFNYLHYFRSQEHAKYHGEIERCD